MRAGHRTCGVAMFVAANLLLLTGCAQVEQLQNSDKETLGTGIGAMVGGLAGQLVGGRAGQTVQAAATAGGAIAGGLLGRVIGQQLDERDRQRMATAAQSALASGEPQGWDSAETGASGTATVIADNSNTPRSGPTCKTVRNAFKLADGSEHQEDVTTCLGQNGWEVQDGSGSPP